MRAATNLWRKLPVQARARLYYVLRTVQRQKDLDPVDRIVIRAAREVLRDAVRPARRKAKRK